MLLTEFRQQIYQQGTWPTMKGNPMANSPIQGNTRESVAYALLLGIAKNEDKVYFTETGTIVDADADWIHQNYIRCLRMVDGVSP